MSLQLGWQSEIKTMKLRFCLASHQNDTMSRKVKSGKAMETSYKGTA